MTVLERWLDGPRHDGRLILRNGPDGGPEVWLARPEGVLTFCHTSAIMPVIPVRDDAKFEECLKRFQGIWENVLLILGSNSL